ncbi:preprotein translocase subunit SecG [Desulfosoma caldarium]|uniref:Protein-export membrane protein SecG n=1 Tax=Desulfosoma caldarium TaxID=610254 RepID=A0A3N1UNQ7_9BACT|nr:preprotein translocase subunit SecG [Desulfosoma caldarium]ROQ91029.1 protein translocase subunit secG [Desulfosoma caldarium]
MQTILITFHVLACLALIFIVLLQTGRGAEIGAVFGGSSQTLFGSTGGTTFLGKLTTLAAVVFMLTCLGLTYLSGQVHTKSVMDKVPVKEEPLLPEAKPVQPASAPSTVETQPVTPPPKGQEAAQPAAQPDTAAPVEPEAPSGVQGKPTQ